ncbi:TIR domain-containing protein [Helicobacter pylori]|uniref:TIR domain-containing protein n=1 Tax=Helicobacter pylori TaxID=210 RepID=UPI002F350259
MKEYKIFISHSWKYDNHYNKLLNLLEKTGLKFEDWSVPKDDPIHTSGTDKELYNAIENKIKRCSCVIVLAGVYATHSKWIDKEIEIAKNLNKKIIAVEYWGSERTSQFVKENADCVVGWNSGSIKDAIR